MGQRENLLDELRTIEHGYSNEITPAKQRRARAILKLLHECVCRMCGTHYSFSAPRSEYQGFCSARCQHVKAKSLGYRKGQGKTEYKVLVDAGDIGSVFVIPPEKKG